LITSTPIGNRLPLYTAQIIVAGGRGLGYQAYPDGPSSFTERARYGVDHLLRPLADKLGGVVAVSRALNDAFDTPLAPLVGQSGGRVAPRLYLAVGISGQVQHQQGMRAAGCIIAINPDDTAPIHQIAHIRVIAEAAPVLSALLARLDAHRA